MHFDDTIIVLNRFYILVILSIAIVNLLSATNLLCISSHLCAKNYFYIFAIFVVTVFCIKFLHSVTRA